MRFPDKGPMRHGNGTFIDGLVKYEGTWVEDAMDGEGVCAPILWLIILPFSFRLSFGPLSLKMVLNVHHLMLVSLKIIHLKGKGNIHGLMELRTPAAGTMESLFQFGLLFIIIC